MSKRLRNARARTDGLVGPLHGTEGKPWSFLLFWSHSRATSGCDWGLPCWPAHLSVQHFTWIWLMFSTFHWAGKTSFFFRVHRPAFSLPVASPVLAKALKRPIIVHFKAFSCNRGDSGTQGPLLLQPHPSGAVSWHERQRRISDNMGSDRHHSRQFSIKKKTDTHKHTHPKGFHFLAIYWSHLNYQPHTNIKATEVTALFSWSMEAYEKYLP